MARTKQTGRRDKAPAKKPAKKKALKKSTQQPIDADAPAHPNELKLGTSYDRCDRERFDLSTKGTTFAHLKTKPPRFVRGR